MKHEIQSTFRFFFLLGILSLCGECEGWVCPCPYSVCLSMAMAMYVCGKAGYKVLYLMHFFALPDLDSSGGKLYYVLCL